MADETEDIVAMGELLQPLVERGLTAVVPPRFLRPSHQRPGATPLTTGKLTLPVISLKNLSGDAREGTMAELQGACEQWDFCQVVDHGIPKSVLDSVKEASLDFFMSPLEDKNLCANHKEGRVAGYGRLFKVSETALWDWVDVLTHRVWPCPLSDQDAAAWPPKPPSYKPAMETYSEEVRKLKHRLMGLFSENLGLPQDSLREGYGFQSQVVRLNYYPPCPQPDLVMGLSSHSDPGGITILLQVSDVCGLQVRKDGVWVPVQPEPDALIVNMGDQMQVITNGKYKSVEHRVVANESESRLSIGTFCSPPFDTIVSPLPELVDRAHSALYPKFMFGDYARLFMKHELGGKRFLDCVSECGRLPRED